ncbi:MerR family transcriptional regulator [Cellulosimicrobium cellulans]|uniref:MerR family transcriptional regulator n=1 Tax=Cellulosimicrobium cellulans TaxID=1710 RepID=UPI000848A2B0|nr:MerR family transcriptional regulator [Cellulosimicrobium cellulans]
MTPGDGSPSGCPPGPPLRTADVARATGYSLQQVRDLERLGVLPPAVRSAQGYRAFTPVHVAALHAYRGVAAAAGPVVARRLLAELWHETLDRAAASVADLHVGLAREREEVLRAQDALRTIRAELAVPAPAARDDGDAMTITELAEALGVRTSTLRFWEAEGLLDPERVTSLRVRRYPPGAVARARVVVALRSAGHPVPAVRDLLAALDGASGVERAEGVLRERLERIAQRSVALLRAGADLAAVVEAVGGTTSG